MVQKEIKDGMNPKFVDIRILEELANSNSKEKITSLINENEYSTSIKNLIYKISENTNPISNNDVSNSRVNEMQMVLMNYANHNFDAKVSLTNKRDIFDALALTINITGEELKHNHELILQRDKELVDKSIDLEVANEGLKASLNKQLFLKQELHHRVKNNLQFIAGLLLLKVQDTNHPELERILLDVQTKVISISKLHDIMLESESTNKVEFNSYLSKIGAMLLSTAGLKGSVNVSGESFQMNIEPASRLAIVFNEIITNSIKYNWKVGLENQITIGLGLSTSHLMVHYSEGESNFDFNYPKNGMGSKLYDMLLLQQLKATKHACQAHLNCTVFSIPKDLLA